MEIARRTVPCYKHVIENDGEERLALAHALEATERREGLLKEADVILAVDVVDLYGALQAFADEAHAVQKERGAAEEREEDEVRFAHVSGSA